VVAAVPGVARRELLRTLVERQLRLRAKRSVLGVLWPVVAPLFLLALYTFVFGSVFEAPIDRYGIYLFAGLLPWTFLVQTVHDALQSISFEPDLVRRAPFPHELLPLSRVAVMLLPFLVVLLGFVGWVAATDDLRPALLPLLPVAVVALVLLVATLAVLLALVDVFNRDLRQVLNNLLTVWFFLVPIVYSPRMAGDRLEVVRALDPVHRVVGLFRDVLYDGRVGDWWPWVLTPLGCALAFVAGLALFRRLAVDLAKEV
jgi:ABC-type polysaccharide/polyol phosphate export permease